MKKYVFQPRKKIDTRLGEEFYKYPSIPYLEECEGLLNEELEIYEKVDGGNFQFRVYKGRILTGSKSGYIGKSFRHSHFGEFDRMIKKMVGRKAHKINPRYIFYCEYLTERGHTLSYPKRFRGKAVLIDVYDIEEGRFLPYEEAKRICDGLKLDFILLPKLNEKARISEKELRELLKGSIFEIEKKEGVVMKNYELQIAAKYVDKDFREIRDTLSLEESSAIDRIVERTVGDIYSEIKHPERGRVRKRVFEAIRESELGTLLQNKEFEKACKMRIEQAIEVKINDMKRNGTE